MKIKIYILAFDGNQNGTTANWFYSKKELYRALIEWTIGEPDEEEDAAKAIAHVEAGDYDDADDLINDHAEGGSCTWELEEAIIDTDIAAQAT